MGIPKFYRWISERYPCLSQVVRDYQVSGVGLEPRVACKPLEKKDSEMKEAFFSFIFVVFVPKPAE